MKQFVVLIIFSACFAAFLVECRTIRDTSKSLTNQGIELVELVDKAIKHLASENRTHEISSLKAEKAKLKLLLTNLENAADELVVKHIEHELKEIEDKLKQDLEKLGYQIENHGDDGHNDGDHKVSLLQKANELELKTKLMIKELKSEKNNAEAAVLEKEVALVQSLAKKLRSTSGTSDLKQIEKELKNAEERLLKELKHPIGY